YLGGNSQLATAEEGTTKHAKHTKQERKVVMTKAIHGKVHGKIIELDEDLGLAEGQEVEVQVRVIAKTPRTPGEGFLRTAGALADDPEWDEIMKEVHQA